MCAKKTLMTIEIINEIFSNAAFDTEPDNDGDVYIYGENIEIPIWISLGKENLLKIFTFVDLKENVTFDEAVAFSNYLNAGIAVPAFHVYKSNEEKLRLWAQYYYPMYDEVSPKSIITIARRFSGAVVAGLRLDEEGKFI